MLNIKIAVIGAGNGGQAIAGYLAMQGYSVSLYDIDTERILNLKRIGGITLTGKIKGIGKLACITNDIKEAVVGARIIMVTTTANAHKAVANQMSSYIEENQIIILNPGRTCGALIFKQELKKNNVEKKYYIAEAQTLVYACRLIEDGLVNIIGIKDEVYLAGLPASDTLYILDHINKIYPCFKAVPNVLYTSFENIGAMFHPCICLLNAATIERHDEFWFYRDMTERVADFMVKCDVERINIGKAYGIDLISITDWIKVAYKDTNGETLCERMKNNPAYHDIKGPGSIFSRQLTEDIPTGLIPLIELAKVAGIKTPIMSSIVTLSQTLLNIDFNKEGRTLDNMGLINKNKQEIIDYIEKEM